MKQPLWRGIALFLCLGILVGAVMVSAATGGIAKAKWFMCEELKSTLAETQERMDAAHDMAEAARALGMPETDHVIVLAKAIWNEASWEAEAAKSSLSGLTCEGHVYSYELFQSTHLTEEAFDYLLAGSALAGHGADFVALEESYGVNGLFALAVAKVESGLGRSKLAVKKNNYYGMLGNSFADPHEGILAFGRLMNKGSYYGRSLDAIARTYCPPTAEAWANAVRNLMGTYWVKLS